MSITLELLLQPKRIPSRHRIVSAIAVQIGSIASESNRVWLEEAADVGGVKAVAQIIQANVAIPLLAGEEMAHAKRTG